MTSTSVTKEEYRGYMIEEYVLREGAVLPARGG